MACVRRLCVVELSNVLGLRSAQSGWRFPFGGRQVHHHPSPGVLYSPSRGSMVGSGKL